MTTYIDSVTSEVHCPTCGVRCKLPIPGPASVLVRFLHSFDTDHRHRPEFATYLCKKCGVGTNIPNHCGPGSSP
jgi:predicted RNA-binding Zn-ribbon protein involved in translation (DUF1610 family)